MSRPRDCGAWQATPAARSVSACAPLRGLSPWRAVRVGTPGLALTSQLQQLRGFAKRARVRKRKFVDRVRVQVTGGQGGRGVVSFESTGIAKKRAVGGNGGRGGDVIIEASQHVHALSFQTYVFKGRNGTDATGKGKSGRQGKDTRFLVPMGTVIKQVDRTYDVVRETKAEEELRLELMRHAVEGIPYDAAEESDYEYEDAAKGDAKYDADSGLYYEAGESDADTDADAAVAMPARDTSVAHEDVLTTLAELDAHGQTFVAARGGAPGMGNRSLRRDEETPETPHIAGQPGTHMFLELELKTIADVGLVGFPNAGKSTFLGAVSRARPKVAPYPFTTLHPFVGIVNFPDTYRITVADIPGLIDGAHENRGLGHEFLRHVERTKVLLYIVDVSPDNERHPADDLRSLQNELAAYSEELVRRPAAVFANKTDVAGLQTRKRLAELRDATLLPVLDGSAMRGANVPLVVDSLRWLCEQAEKQADE